MSLIKKSDLGSSYPWRDADVPLEVLVDDGPVVPSLFGHSLQVPSCGINKAPSTDSAVPVPIAILQMQHARVVGRCGQTLDGARPGWNCRKDDQRRRLSILNLPLRDVRYLFLIQQEIWKWH